MLDTSADVDAADDVDLFANADPLFDEPPLADRTDGAQPTEVDPPAGLGETVDAGAFIDADAFVETDPTEDTASTAEAKPVEAPAAKQTEATQAKPVEAPAAKPAEAKPTEASVAETATGTTRPDPSLVAVTETPAAKAGKAEKSTKRDKSTKREKSTKRDKSGDTGDDHSTEEKASRWRGPAEWLLVVFGAVLLAMLLRAFVFTAFFIPSQSMETTLLVDDRVLVNRLSYRFGQVDRGDIVVFERLETDTANNATDDLIKRVIGLPGETIKGEDNRIKIYNPTTEVFDPLVEPYLSETARIGDFGPIDIPDDSVFVMGDNRANSADSRVFGPVPEDRIIGRAFLLFWPISRGEAL